MLHRRRVGRRQEHVLHVLGGLDRVDQGSIALDGVQMDSMRDAEVVDFRTGRVGLVFPFHHMLPELQRARRTPRGSRRRRRTPIRRGADRAGACCSGWY